MPTLLLIDGHSQAYRAFFGVKTPLSTRSGEPTTAVFGFVRKFLSILREYKPDQVAVAFDAGDTWRHAEFAPYKATRDAMPDEMRTQMARIQQFLEAFHVPVVTYPDFEADDVLGTLARRAAEHGVDVLILTGDRDMFQLVDDRIRILYTRGGPNPETVVYGRDEVNERYGLSPEQFVDFKALIGDSSDNIPGVQGVGEKTAAKFLAQYEDIDNLYRHIDDVSGPARQNLVDAKDDVARNRRLMAIVTDLDLEYDADRFSLSDYDRDAVLEFFQELEFRSLARELPQSPAEAEAQDGGAGVSETGQISLFPGAETAATSAPVDSPYPASRMRRRSRRSYRSLPHPNGSASTSRRPAPTP